MMHSTATKTYKLNKSGNKWRPYYGWVRGGGAKIGKIPL